MNIQYSTVRLIESNSDITINRLVYHVMKKGSNQTPFVVHANFTEKNRVGERRLYKFLFQAMELSKNTTYVAHLKWAEKETIDGFEPVEATLVGLGKGRYDFEFSVEESSELLLTLHAGEKVKIGRLESLYCPNNVNPAKIWAEVVDAPIHQRKGMASIQNGELHYEANPRTMGDDSFQVNVHCTGERMHWKAYTGRVMIKHKPSVLAFATYMPATCSYEVEYKCKGNTQSIYTKTTSDADSMEWLKIEQEATIDDVVQMINDKLIYAMAKVQDDGTVKKIVVENTQLVFDKLMTNCSEETETSFTEVADSCKPAHYKLSANTDCENVTGFTYEWYDDSDEVISSEQTYDAASSPTPAYGIVKADCNGKEFTSPKAWVHGPTETDGTVMVTASN